MGMSIEDVITALERDIHNARLCGYQIDQYKIAIKTMRKYQKIQEIVSSKTTRLSYEDGFRQIKEVLEDGKIDRHRQYTSETAVYTRRYGDCNDKV